MRVIVAGSRTITDRAIVHTAIAKSGYVIGEVVCGDADGVDTLGRLWAEERGIPVRRMPAKWRVRGQYNPNAGYERNEAMGDYADVAVIVWDGESTGTQHMMKYMRKLNKRCYIFRTDFIDLFEGFN